MSQSVLITGALGGVGAVATQMFSQRGFKVIAIDNNSREKYFGKDGSVSSKIERFKNDTDFYQIDIRDDITINEVFKENKDNIKLVLHLASQPSHDFATSNILLDFDVNARATIILLEATYKYCRDAPFIFASTNKVYGDHVNRLPLMELETRFDFNDEHLVNGINETMSIDNTGHSFMGSSKCAADVYVQEYGRYHNMLTACFRAGCLTGHTHAGSRQHGFLNFLIKCVKENRHYVIEGTRGKQVRDQLAFSDLCEAFWQFNCNPKAGAVYNIGGGYSNAMSILETIQYLYNCGYHLDYSIDEKARKFDHIVYYTDLTKFKADYPEWNIKKHVRKIIDEMLEAL